MPEGAATRADADQAVRPRQVLRRDQLLRNPQLARYILIAGAAVYFLLCVPLYGRRGFPEVDPFWLAMIWLWVPPICISAAFDRLKRRRVVQLLVYALIAGFIVSWGTVEIVPNDKGPGTALWELIFYGPTLILATMGIEAVSRLIWARVRRFPSHPYCERCGYWLRGLTQPRCPECGTSFLVEQLEPSYSPSATPLFRRWSSLLILFVLMASAVFPFAYHLYRFCEVTRSGADAATLEWASGKAKWFTTKEELDAMTPEQAERFGDLFHRPDPATGLEIRQVIRQDWRHRVYEMSYRKVIERKLRESGRSPPDFRRPP